MEILVCVKRVPTVGGAITLTADRRAIDTKMSGFTISPHEECAVEEAVRLVERFGGSVTVVAGGGFDLVLLGNEASDTGDYQVGIRLAHLLGWPVATGIKALAVGDAGSSAASSSASSASASRTYRGVLETFALALPCVVTVKEGLNLPRYPSLPGRLRAKRAAITRVPGPGEVSADASGDASGGALPAHDVDVRMTSLRVPDAPKKQATVLGWGAEAVPALVNVLVELGVVS